MEGTLPFGKGRVQFEVLKKNLIGIIEPNYAKIVPNPRSEIRRALDNPIGSEELKKLVRAGEKISDCVY